MVYDKEDEKEKNESFTQLRNEMLEEMRKNDAMVRAIGKATFKKRKRENNERRDI